MADARLKRGQRGAQIRRSSDPQILGAKRDDSAGDGDPRRVPGPIRTRALPAEPSG
jgi:hypothetical protein